MPCGLSLGWTVAVRVKLQLQHCNLGAISDHCVHTDKLERMATNAHMAREIGDAEVPSSSFYSQYHGHPLQHLHAVHEALRAQGKSSLIWLAGDSSLDNKFWIGSDMPAANGYERILKPPRSVADVCHHLNAILNERGHRGVGAINTAIEATTLGQRRRRLLDNDAFLRDHIQPDDVLIVSVGGNDVALAPSCGTIGSAAALVCCTPTRCVLNETAPCGLDHFRELFGAQLQAYVEKLVARRKPRKVVLCMIYFPSERPCGSWAECALCCLCCERICGEASNTRHSTRLSQTR